MFLSSTCRSHLDVFRAVLSYSLVLCSTFFVGVLRNPVCDFHTLLLHVCVAPLSFIHVLCTFSMCFKGFVFKAREYLHQMVGKQNCPIRLVIIHLVVLAPGLWCVNLSGFSVAMRSTLSVKSSIRPCPPTINLARLAAACRRRLAASQELELLSVTQTHSVSARFPSETCSWTNH